MSRLFLTLMFSLLTVTGLGLIVYAARLKPARDHDTTGTGDDIMLEFSDAGEGSSEILHDMDFDEKKHFDPGKHRPEKIESKKPGEGSDPAA